METKKYSGIDLLRTIACIGIVMMHIQAGNNYSITGFLYDRIIPSFNDFIFLFIVISAFGMCCGYYKKIMENSISMEDFYIKRYKKILPFFSVLVLLDIAIAPSIQSLYEGFADITLLFGLFPNDISVIGVGWFLGMIFAFYLIFPFFCVLLKSRKRAWAAFTVSLALNFICSVYFDIDRHNIVYCLCYLLAGGLIYLYANELETVSKKYPWAVFAVIALNVVLYYAIRGNTITKLLVSVSMLIYALGRVRGVSESRFIRFFSSVSMEVYLSHMVIFRGIEKLHINTILGDGWLQYAVTVITVLVGAAVFSVILKKILKIVGKFISEKLKPAEYRA